MLITFYLTTSDNDLSLVDTYALVTGKIWLAKIARSEIASRVFSLLINLLNEAAARQKKQTTAIEPTNKVPSLLTALFGGYYETTRTSPF